MYKVFYNEKALSLSEKPLENSRNLNYLNPTQFDEALAILKNTSENHVHIFYHNLEKIWQEFVNRFDYLEAAGGIVENKNKEILFIKRLGKWDLPKGKVEIGETISEAAVREVQEETGIQQIQLIGFLTQTYHIYFQENLKLKTTYWYKMKHEDDEILIPQLEEGITKVIWRSEEDWDQLFQNTYENIKIVLATFNSSFSK